MHPQSTRAVGIRAQGDALLSNISIPSLILAMTVFHLLVGGVALAKWLQTENAWWIDTFFRHQGTLFFLAMAFFGLVLSIRAWRQFEPGEELRPAWLLITLSAGCHVVGSVVGHLLGGRGYLNPLVHLGSSRETIHLLAELGWLIRGPVQMVFLAVGLSLVLRVYKRIGLLATKLRIVDYLLLLIVGAYTITHLYDVAQILPETSSVLKMIGWTSDPLLSVLLLLAVFLRRSVANAGWSLVSKCWGAFCAAIFITSVGDMGIWAVWHGYLAYPFDSVTWYVWFLASTAYALGPAYQVEATAVAYRRVRHLHAS